MSIASWDEGAYPLVKGSSTRQKVQNSKGYAEPPEFSPAQGQIIFGEKSVASYLR